MCVCGGGGVWNSLISKKNSPLFFFFKKICLLFFKMLIDFCQFLYVSMEKVLFKAEMRRRTLAHNLNIQCI